jgi:uncharacterized membrane protein
MSREAIFVPLALVGIVALMAVLNMIGIASSIVAVATLVLLPGAGLGRLLVPARIETTGSAALVALGLGLAFAVVVGVALDLTTIGIEHAPTVLMAAATVSAIALAPSAWRRMQRWRVASRRSIHQASLIALALVLATGAYVGARVAAERQRPTELTQLWILPSSGDGIRVGITNVGTSAGEWRLVVRMGEEILADEEAIGLLPDESWEITVRVPDRAMPVSASLFGPDDIGAAQEVTLAPRND